MMNFQYKCKSLALTLAMTLLSATAVLAAKDTDSPANANLRKAITSLEADLATIRRQLETGQGGSVHITKQGQSIKSGESTSYGVNESLEGNHWSLSPLWKVQLCFSYANVHAFDVQEEFYDSTWDSMSSVLTSKEVDLGRPEADDHSALNSKLLGRINDLLRKIDQFRLARFQETSSESASSVNNPLFGGDDISVTAFSTGNAPTIAGNTPNSRLDNYILMRKAFQDALTALRTLHSEAGKVSFAETDSENAVIVLDSGQLPGSWELGPLARSSIEAHVRRFRMLTFLSRRFRIRNLYEFFRTVSRVHMSYAIQNEWVYGDDFEALTEGLERDYLQKDEGSFENAKMVLLARLNHLITELESDIQTIDQMTSTL